MGVYLHVKFEVSNIILTGFRQGGGNFTLPPLPQNEPLKNPLGLGLIKLILHENDAKLLKF